MIEKLDFKSEYFSLYKVGTCYAAIQEHRLTGSNAGFVDLGDKVIVFDTFLSIAAAKDLSRAIQEYTGKSPAYVINSHEHTDHYIGNQVFDAPIIATKHTKNAIFESIPKIKDFVSKFPEDIVEKRNEEIKNEEDEGKKANLLNELNFIENLIVKELKIKVPDRVIAENFEIQGDKGTAVIEIVGSAHTKGDIIMKVANQKVCFMGDLLFTEAFPWLGSGNPIDLNKYMETLLEQDFDYFIPGHGLVATKKELQLQIKYVKEILEIGKEYKKNGKSLEAIKLNELSEEFHDWEDMVFKWNNQFLESFLTT